MTRFFWWLCPSGHFCPPRVHKLWTARLANMSDWQDYYDDHSDGFASKHQSADEAFAKVTWLRTKSVQRSQVRSNLALKKMLPSLSPWTPSGIGALTDKLWLESRPRGVMFSCSLISGSTLQPSSCVSSAVTGIC